MTPHGDSKISTEVKRRHACRNRHLIHPASDPSSRNEPGWDETTWRIYSDAPSTAIPELSINTKSQVELFLPQYTTASRSTRADDPAGSAPGRRSDFASSSRGFSFASPETSIAAAILSAFNWRRTVPPPSAPAPFFTW